MSSARRWQPRQLPDAVHRLRIAVPDRDLLVVRDLDDAAFPPDSPDQQRAAPGELEDGVRAGDIWLLERDGRAAAYLHMDRQTPGRVYVSGLAVRPEFQGGGLGRLMIDHFLATMRPALPGVGVVAVTSPRNLVMLRLIASRGFAARWVLPDFFGPGRDRFCCQLRTAGAPEPSPDEVVERPVAELDDVFDLMLREGQVVRNVLRRGGRWFFTLSAPLPGEFVDCTPPRNPD